MSSADTCPHCGGSLRGQFDTELDDNDRLRCQGCGYTVDDGRLLSPEPGFMPKKFCAGPYAHRDAAKAKGARP